MNWRIPEEQNVFIKKGCHVSFTSGLFSICCNGGILWLTWPGSGDVILREGEEISLKTKGTLCITAFEDCDIYIKGKKLVRGISCSTGFSIKKNFSASPSLT